MVRAGEEAGAPACSLEMQENSRIRKAWSVCALVVAARRLMSSRSTLAGWCFTSCKMPSTQPEQVA